MPLFSIIVTVYNTSKYLDKCINSIMNQTFKDFELVIVNDGSTDSSEKIIDEYVAEHSNITKINKENGGISSARNCGISSVKGEYFLFIDGDDYVNGNLLEVINKNISEDIDVLSYNIQRVNEKGEVVEKVLKPGFEEKTGEEAIIEFINNSNLFDTPVAYIYRTKYFLNNNFQYAPNKEHEDFGLTPLVIAFAEHVKSIEDVLYNYLQNEESNTRTTDYSKTVKKANDMLYHFDNMYQLIKNSDLAGDTKKIFNSFIANSLILKVNSLEDADRKEYITELKNRNVSDLLLDNTLPRKVKKIIMRMKGM